MLIIGATGIIGRALVEAALTHGHEVTGVSYDATEPSDTNIASLHHLHVDRNDAAALRLALSAHTASWDVVIDVICYRPDQVHGLLSALSQQPGHIFAISSALLYDRRASLPLHANSPLAPGDELGGYGLGKVAMEAEWLDACGRRGWPVTILRLPHVLGVGCLLGAQPLHNRDATLLSRIVAGLPLFLTDGGRIVLQTIASRDVAQIILAGCHKASTVAKTYNCVSPELITGRMYYEEIAACLGKPVVIKSIPAEAVWASSWGWDLTTVPRLYDSTDLLRDFGMLPNIPFRECARECVNALVSGTSVVNTEDDPFARIDSAITEEQRSLSAALSSLAGPRRRHGVDARMNMEPKAVYV
jgi:nucleoside-diphosphate-sugar epimerase